MSKSKPTWGEIIAPSVFLIVALGLIFYISWDMIEGRKQYIDKLQECLSPIAETYCEDIDMIFYVEKSYSTYFYCFEDRAYMGKKFVYKKDEIDKCKEFAISESDVE